MKKSIQIGPIKRRPLAKASLTSAVRAQVKKMKLGEFFEISQIDLDTVKSLRVSLSYFSKKDGFKVKTTYRDNLFIVDRVRK